MLRCDEIKGCPASLYMRCIAYKNKKNCWEVSVNEVACCNIEDKSKCKECYVYQKAIMSAK
jgi:hypothetical protein